MLSNKWLVAVCCLVSMAACGCTAAGPTTRPDDFSVEYHWRAGTMPPPYHYEYDIMIDSDGTGEIAFTPDYPGEEIPVWRESFSASEELLDALFAKVAESGLFAGRLPEREDSPVGGSVEWMEVTAQGETYEVPDFVEGNRAAVVAETYDLVRSAVPEEIWDRLNEQRADYEEEYLNRED